MSVLNAPVTHRQCPRCHKVQPARARICAGCGRRFQVPPPEPLRFHESGVYARVSSPQKLREAGETESGRGVSAWWGPAFAALFVTPLGWVLLPLALLLCLLTAALSLTVLPTLLGVIAALRLRSARLPVAGKATAIVLTLALALGLNGLFWHVVHQAAFTLSPPP